MGITYHPVFCVSRAISSLVPSFSVWRRQQRAQWEPYQLLGIITGNLPRSLMFLTPLFFFSFVASVMLAVMLCPKLESGVRFGACVTSVSGPMLRGAVAISMNASEIGSRERTYDCVCKEN